MGLMEYLSAIRQRWLTIAIVVVLGAGIGLTIGKLTTPTYRATSEVFVTVSSGENVGELVQGSTFTQNIVQSYAQLATTPIVLDPVIEKLSLNTTARHLAKRIQVDSPVNTVIIKISVDAINPEEAAEIANAIAAELPRTVNKLMPHTTSGSQISLTTVAQAHVPGFPISPNTKLYAAIGVVLGGMIGVLFAVILRLLDTRVGGREDLSETSNLPVLGVIPKWTAKKQYELPLIEEPDGAIAESYRTLRSNLDFIWSDDPGSKAVVLTSAMPSDGKTTTSLNLALALAERGKNVIVVDLDLRRPSIAKATGLIGNVGLTTVLIDKVSLRQAIQVWGNTELDILSSGEIPPNALQLIDSPRMTSLIERLKDLYDYVILDAPPLLSVVDASILARKVDGTILVVASGQTKRTQVTSALGALEQAGKRPLGTVLTRGREAKSTYSYSSRGS